MIAARFKRILMWLLPVVFVTVAAQYHRTGRIEGYAIAITLVASLAMYFTSNGLNHLWVRAFGTGRIAVNALTVLWALLAICLFVFFYRMM